MDIGWNQIAKAGAVLGLIAAAIAVIWLGIHAIHKDGRAVERAECLAGENKQLVWKQQQIEEANARNLTLIEANSKLNDRVTNNAAKENQKIHAADAALRSDPDGLRIPAETCRTEPVPATSDSAGADPGGGRADWLRLPGRTESDLYDYALKANRTRVKRDECREWAIGLQKMREEWERAQEKSDGEKDSRQIQ
jgi:hypothetical protein